MLLSHLSALLLVKIMAEGDYSSNFSVRLQLRIRGRLCVVSWGGLLDGEGESSYVRFPFRLQEDKMFITSFLGRVEDLRPRHHQIANQTVPSSTDAILHCIFGTQRIPKPAIQEISLNTRQLKVSRYLKDTLNLNRFVSADCSKLWTSVNHVNHVK
jgi:hypothetical protein